MGVMVFNTTFNNISVISWQSILLVEANGVPGKNHRKSLTNWIMWFPLTICRYREICMQIV